MSKKNKLKRTIKRLRKEMRQNPLLMSFEELNKVRDYMPYLPRQEKGEKQLTKHLFLKSPYSDDVRARRKKKK